MLPCNNRMIIDMSRVLIVATVCALAGCIGVPLHSGPRCMVIQGQYDTIKLEVKFPAIPGKKDQEKFKISLMDFYAEQVIFDVLVDEKAIYRKNLDLQTSKIYNLCLEVQSSRRNFDSTTEQMWAEYTADEDFDALIGTFEVPAELRGEANLQYIYNVSESISHLGERIIQNQEKERNVEDSISSSNLHKNQSISMLTIIECLVIVLSGIYQVLALRRFLIEKNLY